MFGPDAPWAGIFGQEGEITAGSTGAVAAKIARWSIKRSGTNPGGKARLRFRAHFSWRSEVLLRMCGRGEIKPRIKVFMKTLHEGDQQVDVVNWDEWRIDDDGALTLENVLYFDVEPLKMAKTLR